MMDHIDWVAVVEFVGFLVTGIISYATLRSRVANVETQLGKLETKHDALDSKTFEKLMAIERALARIEGRLSERFKNDID